MVHAYRTMQDVPGYARRVPVSEIAAEEYNCNIRRYVDNAPPPEPHDVRAHLHGGVPVSEIDALVHFWSNYPGLRERSFVACDGDARYADFAPAATDRRALATLVNTDPGVAAAHRTFLDKLDAWWTRNLPREALAPTNGGRGNVYALRAELLADVAQTFADQNLLNEHQVRGAFARYVDDLKADLKSIAASSWGPELIPDGDILQSQFPELLAEVEQKRLRVAELSALFAAANEEDYDDSDDSGVLPGEEVKSLKAQLKELNAQARLAKRGKRKGDWEAYTADAREIEKRLAPHKEEERGRESIWRS